MKGKKSDTLPEILLELVSSCRPEFSLFCELLAMTSEHVAEIFLPSWSLTKAGLTLLGQGAAVAIAAVRWKVELLMAPENRNSVGQN